MSLYMERTGREKEKPGWKYSLSDMTSTAVRGCTEVEGGKYKASFLLPDEEGDSESEGLLISEISNLTNRLAPL